MQASTLNIFLCLLNTVIINILNLFFTGLLSPVNINGIFFLCFVSVVFSFLNNVICFINANNLVFPAL